ncbi:MAG: HAMP domain-containing sensor histidine kinase [Sneathiellaceae bacterium]
MAKQSDHTGVPEDAARDRRDATVLRESIQEFPGPVAVYDGGNRLIAFNAMYRWVHGSAFDTVERRAGDRPIRYEDLIRETAKSVVLPEDMEAHVADRLRAQQVADGKPVDRFYPGRGWFRIVKIRTRSGAVVGFATDVSELKETSLALEQARAAAEAANVAKSAFLANISHELRTPLNAVIGIAEALELGIFGPIADERHRQHIANIRQSGHHLLSLIADLLDLAKVEAGAMEVERTTFALAELFADCATMLQPIADRRPASLMFRPPPARLRLLADGRKIKQVMINIVNNAIKFSHPGGTVLVTVDCDGKGLRIHVDDDGIGLDQEKIEIAFQPFSRLDHTLSTPSEGTGLGLPIAQRFVELHGGTLEIAARQGRGTRVTVVLPPDCLAPDCPAPHGGDTDTAS